MMTTRKQFKITYSTLGSPDPLLHTYYEEALQGARANLGRTHRMYIDGQWVEAAATYATYSPIDTSLHMGSFQDGTAADIDRAVTAARAAYPGWRATPWQDRVALLRRAAELISERLFTIAAVDSLEVGKNRLEALGDVEEVADFIRTYCDVMQENHGFAIRQRAESRHHRNTSVLKPYGVWAVISPFNFPIALSGGPTAAALIAGNTVVLKPAEDTPYGPTLLMECFVEAGLPPGVINFVTGQKETGRALVDHSGVDGITFTGSYRVGMEIYAKVAGGRRPRPVITEMGGKNPTIVARSADLDLAAEGVARAAFGLSGQKCSACSRVYVHADVKDAFAAKLAAQAEKVQIGDPTQQDCVDEATNTTSYMMVLEQNGLLKYHKVGAPFSKENLLRGVAGWPHWTAVLIEQGSGQHWAVDSWIYPNGENPAVVETEKWYINDLNSLPKSTS